MQADWDLEAQNAVNRVLKAKTVYEVLGVNATVTRDELKKVYRQLSLKVHPDRNPSPNATKAFQKLNTAYNHLLTKQSEKGKSKIPPYKKKDATKEDVTKAEPTATTEGCRAKTQNDIPCKNRAEVGKEYCHVHRNYDPTLQKKPKVATVKVTCAAKCKDDSPCSKSAVEGSQYCYPHRDYDPTKVKAAPKAKVQCAAKTKAGDPCSKYINVGNTYCFIHNNYNQ